MIEYNNIEILNDEAGVPIVNFIIKDLRDYSVKLSLSHSENNAIAFVIIGVEK